MCVSLCMSRIVLIDKSFQIAHIDEMIDTVLFANFLLREDRRKTFLPLFLFSLLHLFLCLFTRRGEDDRQRVPNHASGIGEI